jgi:hypothetical protein
VDGTRREPSDVYRKVAPLRSEVMALLDELGD